VTYLRLQRSIYIERNECGIWLLFFFLVFWFFGLLFLFPSFLFLPSVLSTSLTTTKRRHIDE
jgi:hypothetical protein